MKQRLAWTIGLALLVLPASPAFAMDVKEFKKAFGNTQNSWERRALIQKLDPTDKKSLKILFTVLEDPMFDWYYREGAIDVLAGAFDPGLIKTLEKKKARKDPLLVEAICLAFGRSKNKERVPYILEALKSKKWVVRRAAAQALRHVPDKRSIDPLITAWEEEDKFTVWVHILETLETMTRQKDLGDNPQKWRDWWTVNQDSFEIGKAAGDELSEDEKSGDMIRTKVRGTNLSMRSRGQGLPLLVLPDYGFEKDYLETYLRNLEDTNQILYMQLPGTKDFTDPPLQNAPGQQQPYYPLDRITDAFEALQKKLLEEGKIKGKFAILGHGISAWIAMKFAVRHPRSVRRLILIGATSGEKAASEGIQRLVRTGQKMGDVEMEHYGLSRQYEGPNPKYTAKQGDETWALNRKSFSVRFGDRRNLEIGRLYGPLQGVEKTEGNSRYQIAKWARPMGGCFIPKFSLFKLERVGTPTMVVCGAGSIESSFDDTQAIARHYGRNARPVLFKKSGEMPFIEENEKFVKIVRKWLGGKRAKKKKIKRKKKK